MHNKLSFLVVSIMVLCHEYWHEYMYDGRCPSLPFLLSESPPSGYIREKVGQKTILRLFRTYWLTKKMDTLGYICTLSTPGSVKGKIGLTILFTYDR